MSQRAPFGSSLPELVEVMDRLLAPDGCPWDREQTLESLRPFLIEEMYEVLAALDGGDPIDHCEELGDLLFQIVFQAGIRRREGAFDIDDVVRSIRDKLVRRHPHVFADATAESSDKVLTQWSEIKAQEKREKALRKGLDPDAPTRERLLDSVPAAMPALTRAQQYSERVSRVGFDWPDVAGCRAKVAEELVEIDEAVDGGDPQRIDSEIGDLLFATVSLARKLGVDAEGALARANDKFRRRFDYVEDALLERGKLPRDSDLDEMDALWNEAKARGTET